MNWLISSSSITGWWQISCKCKQSSNLLAQREPGNEASNLHVGFTFSVLSMMTYCGRLYVTTFTFSELSSTHVFTYNGQWIMPSANWHSCQYQNQSSCLYVPHYTYVYNYSCYTVTHLSNGSCQYWYRTLYEYYISMRPMSHFNLWPAFIWYCLSGEYSNLLAANSNLFWAVNELLVVLLLSYSCSAAAVKAV